MESMLLLCSRSVSFNVVMPVVQSVSQFQDLFLSNHNESTCDKNYFDAVGQSVSSNVDTEIFRIDFGIILVGSRSVSFKKFWLQSFLS